jgi:hypothetical protein
MQQTRDNPSLKRRNRLVSIVIVAIIALLFSGGLSLILLK